MSRWQKLQIAAMAAASMAAFGCLSFAQEEGTWKKAGEEVSEAVKAVGAASQNSVLEAKEKSVEALDVAKAKGAEIWDATKDKTAELIDKTEEATVSASQSGAEAGKEAWEKTKEESTEILEKTRDKIHEMTAPSPQE